MTYEINLSEDQYPLHDVPGPIRPGYLNDPTDDHVIAGPQNGIVTGSTIAAPEEVERWLTRLNARLNERAYEYERLERYYEGDHRLVYSGVRWRSAFGGLFHGWSDNFCELVVDASEERLNVQGFRFGSNQRAADKAWDIWQVNRLDAYASLGHIEALVKGSCNILVSPFMSEGPRAGIPLITIETPEETIVATDPSSLRRTAALKRWLGEDGYIYATLYLPDSIWKFTSATKPSGGLMPERIQWVRRETPGEDWPIKNPAGVVPMIPLMNRPRLRRPPRSEIATIIPIQDAINKTLADMLVASEFGSFRQRYLTNYTIEEDEEGNPIEPFKAAIDRMFIVPPPEAGEPEPKFGDFGITPLEPYIKAVEMMVQHIASITRTPPHYLLGQMGVFPSGEALRTVETGLVAKVRDKMVFFGDSWEEAMRLALRLANVSVAADIIGAETLWADPETKTIGAFVDALTKLQTIGVPQEQLWEDYGYSPQQIEKFKAMRAAQPAPPSQGLPAAPNDVAGVASQEG